ncbi:inactive histone-lysine N-methyltransferase 2E-like isoform X2 [Actinia tenebrosa]|uniref:Inactive histone-lysine N-methyltransferase 2E-like isoform X2 n=1 Tax=Actinia tenebrosa TaxID=6105 RepID=A0A6P8I9T2_ACTTE|nr:inactive histone-lysine N-methyltransferase 2E-like isoform X2 [Actinia tenebrosa]
MTAGTDPDPAESSNAVKMPSIMQIRHIPYLDHNYGQPPPMTPPDSSSPTPDDVDTGNEDDEGNAITRCICGFNHDDGYMICCDKCSVWQHIECMGISSENLPENYLCEQCDPRVLDRDRAKAIQSRKREEMSDDDDDDDESAEDADGTLYTAVSNTPTRITLTAKVSHQKRKNPGPRVKGEKDKEKKQKRTKRQKQRLSADFLPVDEETNGPWESNCSKSEYYTEVKECIYSQEILEYMAKLPQNNQEALIPEGTEQFCKIVEVQRNTKGLVTTEDLHKNQFLVKYNGKMMLRHEFDEENPVFRRYNPYVLFYDHQDHLKLCVDARVMGNDARFVRRSCSPNTEVRCIVQNGKLNLVLFSLYPLPKGAEITIPFEFSLAEYNCSLSCACAQDTCTVAKYKLKHQVPSQELNSIMEHNGHKLCDDSSNSSHNPLTTSPLRATLATQNSFQGDSDSDLDNNHERSEAENRRKKLSREERKLEAYVKQIEKMEKKEKKRQQPQKEHRPVLRVSSDEGKAQIRGIRGQRQLSHKRRSNGSSSVLKKKRACASSCSSEPLSPDEVSSSASTPTTPKTVTTIAEEPLVETPSTSPSRNFRFPKTKGDENSQDGYFKTEAVSSSILSSPISPCSPRESETETKQTLSTASSNSDIAMEIEMEESEAGRLEDSCDQVQVSLHSSTTGDLGSALSVRLAEITNVAGTESNTPSPCPSTSASPTSSESVMNGCPSVVISDGRSPGPAPGSPLAALLHGVHVSRSNPYYYSLKKRWLCKFLYSHNGVGVARPANGLRTSLGILQPPKVATLNNKTFHSKLNNIPLPLKKRHLKYLKTSLGTKDEVMNNRTLNNDNISSTHNGPLSDTSDIKPSFNQYVSCGEEHKPASSVHCTVMSNTSKEVIKSSQSRTLENRPSNTRTLDIIQNEVPSNSVDTAQVSYQSTTEHSVQAIVGRGTLDTVPDVKPVMISTTAVRRPSDPRLLSPSASISQQFPQQPTSTVIQTVPITTSVTQSSDVSSGTPGKKKVSLLEYRNRSLQRLSGDGSKPSQPTSSSSTPLGSSSASSVATSVVRSNSEPQPSLSSSALIKKPKNWEANGPRIEPISPDENERIKLSTSSMTGLTTCNTPLFEALAKKEVGMNMYNKKLSALISEQLLSDPKYSPTSSKSPSTASNSPSIPPPPPPPLDTAGKGDAMEIEEEDGVSDQKIFLTTPLVSTSRTPIQPSTQPTSLISEYGHPHQISEYHPSVHDQHLHTRAQNLMVPMMQPSSSQLPSHSQSRITSTPYLVAATASPAMPSQVRFPSYQNPSLQSTTYYHQ